MGLCRLIRRLSYCFKLSKIASNLEIHLASVQYFQELLRICNGNIEEKHKSKRLNESAQFKSTHSLSVLLLSISRTEVEKTRVGTQTQSYSVGSKRTGTRLRFWELTTHNCPHGMFHGPEITLSSCFKTISAHFNVFLELYKFAKKKQGLKKCNIGGGGHPQGRVISS